MAINKNDYLDANGDYDLKKSLVDEVIDEVNTHVAENVSQGSPHGMPSVMSGSKVLHVPTPNTTAILFTIEELKDAFNYYDTTSEQYFCIVNNGDATVSSVHIDGVSWWGGNMQVDFDRSFEGYIRVNYMIFYKR